MNEAGHVALRRTKGSQTFVERFPYLKKDQNTAYRVNKNHRIDVFREEVLAWEKGKEIAEYLCLNLDWPTWDRHRTEALKTYADWI